MAPNGDVYTATSRARPMSGRWRRRLSTGGGQVVAGREGLLAAPLTASFRLAC